MVGGKNEHRIMLTTNNLSRTNQNSEQERVDLANEPSITDFKEEVAGVSG